MKTVPFALPGARKKVPAICARGILSAATRNGSPLTPVTGGGDAQVGAIATSKIIRAKEIVRRRRMCISLRMLIINMRRHAAGCKEKFESIADFCKALEGRTL